MIRPLLLKVPHRTGHPLTNDMLIVRAMSLPADNYRGVTGARKRRRIARSNMGIDVRTDDLEATGQALLNLVDHLSGAASGVRGASRQVPAATGGSPADGAFSAMWSTWDAELSTCVDALRELGQALISAAQAYVAVDVGAAAGGAG